MESGEIRILSRRLTLAGCIALGFVAAIVGAPPWWNLYLLLLLPLYPLAPVSLYAPLTALMAVGAAVTAFLEPVAGSAIFLSVCTMTSLVWMAVHVRRGLVPVIGSASRQRYASLLRRVYILAGGILCLSFFLRGVPLTLSVPWFLVVLMVVFSLPAPPPVPWRRRAAAAFGMAIFAGFGLGGALLILEFGSRLTIEITIPHSQIHALHPHYGWTLRPGEATTFRIPVAENEFKDVYTEISRQGFRDRVYGPKEPGEFRILMLGDSFIFGRATEMEDSIPRQLERVLVERLPGSRIQVINGGISGTGPWQQHGMLRERGFDLQPDLVIQSVYPGNDIGDSLLRVGKHLQSMMGWEYGRLNQFRNRHRPVVAAHFWLDRHSHLYNGLRGSVIHEDGVIALGRHVRGVFELKELSWEINHPRVPSMEPSLEEWYPELALGFDLLTEDILAIRDDCHRRGIPYVVFAIPNFHDISEGAFEFFAQLAGETVAYERGKPLWKLQDFFEREGVSFVDIWNPLDAYSNPADIYYVKDGHFNEVGCRIVAELIADALTRDFPHLIPIDG